MNNGTCKDRIGRFHCECPRGFSGNRCEGDMNECLSNPCFSNGSFDCIQAPGDYKCLCKPGWKGKQCREKVLLCAIGSSRVPCENGATCVETNNNTSYCMCQKVFKFKI